eukprot:scaffold2102_cov161-Amphora_coffeaeformis.AAC.23
MVSRAEIPRSTIKSSRRRRPRKNADEEEENRLPNQDPVLVDDWTKDNMIRRDEEDLKILSKSIRKAEENIQADVVWKSNDALRRAMLRASLCLGSLDSGSDFLLLFNEHESSLIKSCRTLVKEATEAKEEKHQLPRLFLATHTVRALARFITKVPTQEALMQLLYHVINTLGNGKFDRHQDLIYLALEALQHIFLRYKKEAGTTRICCATTAGEEVFLFPIPIYRKGNEAKDDNGLAIDKFFTIAIQSILLVGKAILTRNESSSKDNSLPDFLCRLGKSPLSIARHLLAKVVVEWVHTQARITKNLKDGLSHCRRIHRILWEQAAVADRNPVDCLEMRRDSISVLLSGESKALCKALECKFAETACTYAWKASVAFVAQSNSRPDDNGPLLHFHQIIGRHMDRVYGNKFGLAYLEYCSFRAQHVGIYTKVSIGRSNSEHIQTEVLLKVALLSVTVNRRLVVAAAADCNDLLENASDIITEFRSVLFDTSLEWNWSSDEVTRILKIIPVNPLHKSLYGATKDDGTAAKDPLALHIGASLMTQCFGPFLLVATEKLKEERAKWSEKAVDCFLRGMSVFELEILQSTTSADYLVDAIKEVHDLSSQNRLISTETVANFERLAKVRSISTLPPVDLPGDNKAIDPLFSFYPLQVVKEMKRDHAILLCRSRLPVCAYSLKYLQ